jgi:Na+-driven multidrug efflux pump
MGLNNGLQSIIARRAGENRTNEISSIFSQGVYLSIVFAVAGILITCFAAPFIFGSVMHNQTLTGMCVVFLRIRIFGLIFLYLYQMRNALLVGINQSKFLVWGATAEAITNIFFDYVLIYGKLHFPKLGFNGAAFSSVIAEATGLFVIFLVVHYKGISKQLNLYGNFIFNKQNTKLILVQSSPVIGQYALSIIAWELFYIFIEHHGTQALAISNVMRNIFGFFGCFTWAFAATANAMVSNIIGQGMQDKVEMLIHKIIKLSLGFALAVMVFINIFPHLILSIYSQGNDFISAAIPVMRIVSVATLGMSVATIWLNSVTGTGNTKINLTIEIFSISLYIIYIYIVLEKLKLPISFGWMSEWLYWLCIGIPAYLYIKSGKWKNKKI